MSHFIFSERKRPKQIDDLRGLTVDLDPRMNERRKKQYIEEKKYRKNQKKNRKK